MGRPTLYNWEAIKEAYEGGFTKDEIVKKFNVTKATLTNKINKDSWVIKSDVSADIEGIGAELNAVAQNYAKHPEIEDMFIERLNTIKEDNELIGNNRKIAKMLQSVIVKQRDNIDLNNLRSVSGTIKDIESMANPVKPASHNTEVNVQNNTQVNVKPFSSLYTNKDE